MTRENKLALIVGFSLVLVVGVLISDHFSRARAEPIGNDLTPGTAQSFGAAGGGLSTPIGPAQTPASRTSQPLAGFENGGAASPSGGQGIGVEHARSNTGEEVRQAARQPVDIPMTARGTAGQSGDKPEVGPGKKPKEKAGAPVERPETGFAAAPAKKYEVQPNDSWYRIALTEYGDPGLCQKLQAYNKKEDASLRVGAVVLLPTKDVLTGKPADVTEIAGVGKGGAKPSGKVPLPEASMAQSPGKTGAKIKEKPAAPAPMYATYTVKRGDDLSKIAQIQLGSVRRYHEILDLNRDIIDDEESIRPGVTLKMPTK